MASSQLWTKVNMDKLATKLDSYMHQPRLYAYGCCRPELENVQSSTYDWNRLGVQNYSTNSEECNLLIVAGWINSKVAEELKKAHDELRGRKSVIAVGACAISGGPYAITSENIIRAADVLPVDVFVPGCPPRPEALIEAIRKLKELIQPGPDTTTVLYQALKDNMK